MDRESWERLKGFKRLIHDGVGRGADFVEKHHRHAAGKPFRVLESLRPIAVPTRVVRKVHDGVLSITYGGIRAINDATEAVDDWVVNRLEPVDTDSDDQGIVTDHSRVLPDSKPSGQARRRGRRP